MWGIDKDKIKAAFADYQKVEAALDGAVSLSDIDHLKAEVQNVKNFIAELGAAIQ